MISRLSSSALVVLLVLIVLVLLILLILVVLVVLILVLVIHDRFLRIEFWRFTAPIACPFS